MENANALAQQLIDAVTASSGAELKSLDTQRDNQFSLINNKANANGTLYSTQPGFQKSAFVAEKYQPAVAAAKLRPLTEKLNILGQATDITRTIDSMNRAADELNGIVFDY